MRRNVIARYLEALGRGDAIALGITGFFLLFVLFIAVIALKFRADEKRDEERRRKKWQRKQ
jgi:hypothetical protein